MNLRTLLEEKKSSIVKKWVHVIFEQYPPDSTNFFLTQKDRFLNPVGHAISEGARDIFNALVDDSEPEKFYPLLNDIIKIKAVQDFSPSVAISFLFLLKKVIRVEAGAEIARRNLTPELEALESRIDQLILLSFDIYSKFRERIFEIKNDEFRRMTFRLLQRANLICEIEGEKTTPGEETVITNK